MEDAAESQEFQAVSAHGAKVGAGGHADGGGRIIADGADHGIGSGTVVALA